MASHWLAWQPLIRNPHHRLPLSQVPRGMMTVGLQGQDWTQIRVLVKRVEQAKELPRRNRDLINHYDLAFEIRESDHLK